jgi:hypothetical protein
VLVVDLIRMFHFNKFQLASRCTSFPSPPFKAHPPSPIRVSMICMLACQMFVFSNRFQSFSCVFLPRYALRVFFSLDRDLLGHFLQFAFAPKKKPTKHAQSFYETFLLFLFRFRYKCSSQARWSRVQAKGWRKCRG